MQLSIPFIFVRPFQNQKELPSDKPTYGYVELKLIYELNGKFAHADLDIQGNERDIKMAGDGAFTTKLMAVRKASSKLQALNILGDLGYQVVAMSQEDVLKSKVTSYIMRRLD